MRLAAFVKTIIGTRHAGIGLSGSPRLQKITQHAGSFLSLEAKGSDLSRRTANPRDAVYPSANGRRYVRGLALLKYRYDRCLRDLNVPRLGVPENATAVSPQAMQADSVSACKFLASRAADHARFDQTPTRLTSSWNSPKRRHEIFELRTFEHAALRRIRRPQHYAQVAVCGSQMSLSNTGFLEDGNRALSIWAWPVAPAGIMKNAGSKRCDRDDDALPC